MSREVDNNVLGDDSPSPDDTDYTQDPSLGTDFAKLTLKSTSTSNPRRPRTIAAGYDARKGVMTVVFRGDKKGDVWWNYYGVPSDVWAKFTSAPSKGQFLKENGFDEGKYDMGPVNRSLLSSRQTTMLDWVVKSSRQIQQESGGLQFTGDVRMSDYVTSEDLYETMGMERPDLET